MKSIVLLINFLLSLQCVLCRDFYIGMFRRDDYLVAQDNLYKPKRPYSFVQAEYGRYFKCPITYFRVVDRLGVGFGFVKIVRGGLRQKYIAVRIKSVYNRPVSVNIYVGCENRQPRTPKRPWKMTTAGAINATDITGGDSGNSTTPGGTNTGGTTGASSNAGGGSGATTGTAGGGTTGTTNASS